MTADRFFLDIQQAVVDILDADAAFDGVALLSENLGDLDNAIETVFAKLNICVVVTTPFASITSPNLPPVHFNDVPIDIEIWEDTILNRPSTEVNQMHFMELALIALYLLIGTMPRDSEGNQLGTQFYPASPTLIDLRNAIDREKFPNMQGVKLQLKCTSGFVYSPQATLLDGNNQTLLDSMGIRLTTDRPFSRV